jgi:hypothetical protein
MSEDDDFKNLKLLESVAKSRIDEKSRRVLDVLLTDLSFDADGSLDDACKSIDEWGALMDAVIAENLDHDSINSFVGLVTKHKREIEMAQIARKRHLKSTQAASWVRGEWTRKNMEYSSKKEFARTYVTLVIEDFPEIKKVTARTISEEWLKGL